MHDVEPTREYVPALQGKQLVADVALTFVELVPALQFVQDDAPWSLHVPARQEMQLIDVA